MKLINQLLVNKFELEIEQSILIILYFNIMIFTFYKEDINELINFTFVIFLNHFQLISYLFFILLNLV